MGKVSRVGLSRNQGAASFVGVAIKVKESSRESQGWGPTMLVSIRGNSARNGVAEGRA